MHHLTLVFIVFKRQSPQSSSSCSLHLWISKFEQLDKRWNTTFQPDNRVQMSTERNWQQIFTMKGFSFSSFENFSSFFLKKKEGLRLFLYKDPPPHLPQPQVGLKSRTRVLPDQGGTWASLPTRLSHSLILVLRSYNA